MQKDLVLGIRHLHSSIVARRHTGCMGHRHALHHIALRNLQVADIVDAFIIIFFFACHDQKTEFFPIHALRLSPLQYLYRFPDIRLFLFQTMFLDHIEEIDRFLFLSPALIHIRKDKRDPAFFSQVALQ